MKGTLTRRSKLPDMASFFVRRPIVAIVLSILLVLLGGLTLLGLPIAQYPDIVPPEIRVSASYTGADAQTVEQAIATPIEQQMAGVDHMNYMDSTNANNGEMALTVNFENGTDPNTDLILTQMRQTQALSQMPAEVQQTGVTVEKSTALPLILFALTSPKGQYDDVFLANYAYINLVDQMKRVPGISRAQVFGAGKYAMRIWVRPDRLAKLGLTIPEIAAAITEQNTANPAGKIGGAPIPKGQEFTYAIRAQGRLLTEGEFSDIVVRANPDGSLVRLRDVGRIELGAQSYDMTGRMNGKPSALIALYQLPGSNALEAARGAEKQMAALKAHFPADLDVKVALDTTEAVTAGMAEVVETLFDALVLVILVVFLFLQGWRATLIPLLAVPVSLVGTFVLFPLLGFSINTLSLFGLVLAIGLVVDDAIVVVEAVEQEIEKGLSPMDATLKAMKEVSGPVVAIALVLIAVFLPTAFIPGITGALYKQFALTVGVSVALSALNALTLAPALAALLLKHRSGTTKTLLSRFFDAFNAAFERLTQTYVSVCRMLILHAGKGLVGLLGITLLALALARLIPGGFLPEEDQGYLFAVIQLPNAASLERTLAACAEVESAVAAIRGVQSVATVAGFNMLSQVSSTYSAFFFIKLEPWETRSAADQQYQVLMDRISEVLKGIPAAEGFAFAPPAIPGIGNASGISLLLEDRAGKDIGFLADAVDRFIAEAAKRPEFLNVSTTFLPEIPQYYVSVDRDKALKQGVALADVYKTLQTFMGSGYINLFNRFGRTWQVYLQAEGEYRKDPQQLSQFYVRNAAGETVPLAALTEVRRVFGPEFTQRHNLFRSAQVNAIPAPGVSSQTAMATLEAVFTETQPQEMGFEYSGMSFQEKKAAEGVSPAMVFGLSLLCVFLILAAQYESWTLPFAVLLTTPVAVFGAYLGLLIGGFDNNVYAQIALVMLIGLSAKNAILIVEFAKAGVESGLSPTDAALRAARLRLRPILMTSFAAILGFLPLATASGAGALAREATGYVLIGGMLSASLIAICLVPWSFIVIERLKPKANAAAAARESTPPP